MKFNVLASGSKGNMTIIETENTKVLLDVGISMREAKKRTSEVLNDFDAIIISHEHTDHVRSLITFARQNDAYIYINKESFDVVKKRFKDKVIGLKVKFIEENTRYKIKDLNFLTLSLSHDTHSCFGFIFFDKNTSLGYVTDTGFLPIPYIELLKRVDSLIIESNHDVELLHDSDRPWMLKERIFSVKGHMSNYICGQVLNSISSAGKIKLAVLAHLSEDCNTEELAVDTVLEAIEGEYIPRIIVARQNEATGFWNVKSGEKIESKNQSKHSSISL